MAKKLRAEAEADLNPRAVIGDNKPPPTPYETITTHVDDIMVEVRNWCDGEKVETQAQADAVSRLIDDVRKAADAADVPHARKKRARSTKERPRSKSAITS